MGGERDRGCEGVLGREIEILNELTAHFFLGPTVPTAGVILRTTILL